MSDMPKPAAEISEDDAEGVVAEIYRDIRARLDVALVPLVYRQMAVTPSMLEWCWAVLSPLHESNAAIEMGQRVLAVVEPSPLQPVTPAMLDALDLSAYAVSAIRDTLASFSRTNPSNLVSLGALHTLLETDHAHEVETSALSAAVAIRSQRTLPPLLPMLEPDALAPHVVALIRELSAVGIDADDVMPSVWRILARWPAYLALAKVQVEALNDVGWLQAQMERTRKAAHCAWKLLAAEMVAPVSALDEPTRQSLIEITSAFVGARLIHMVPVVRALESTFWSLDRT